MLPILATVTLLLAIGIVVACTKDNNQNTAANTTPTNGAKDPTPQQQLADALFLFWHQSDSAYRANPTVFLSVCSEEDYDDFYELANITKQQLGTIDSLLDKIPAPILTPGDGSSVPPTCIPCVTGLEQYGDNVADLRAVIDELKLYEGTDTVPCFLPPMDSCTAVCIYNSDGQHNYTSSEERSWCLFNCSLRKALNRMDAALAAIKVDD